LAEALVLADRFPAIREAQVGEARHLMMHKGALVVPVLAVKVIMVEQGRMSV
jgi:hypothetical protein